MPDHSKPLGVTLVALYSGFMGLISLPVGCVATLASGAPGVGVGPAVIAFIITGYGLLSFASAYGLWTIQPWGRTFSSGLYVAGIVLGLVAMLPMFPGQRVTAGGLLFNFLGLVITVLILEYLARPQVKQFFSEREARVRHPQERQEPRW